MNSTSQAAPAGVAPFGRVPFWSWAIGPIAVALATIAVAIAFSWAGDGQPSDQAGGYCVMGTIRSGLELLQDIGQAGTVDGSMDGPPLTRVIIEGVEVT